MAQIIREFAPADRYLYDFKSCTADKGWAQLDTRQDASYYGNWINPIKLELFSYCEGDTTVTRCDDEADFIKIVHECVEWHKECEYFIGIDCMCRAEIIAAFNRMGLGDLLH